MIDAAEAAAEMVWRTVTTEVPALLESAHTS
jgi:hypothetical protein